MLIVLNTLVSALIIGVAATLLGYTNLASRIAFAVIWGSVLGGAWLAAARIAEALAEAAIDAGWLDRLRMVRANHALVVRITSSGETRVTSG